MSLTSYRAAPPRDKLCIRALSAGVDNSRQNAKRGAVPARFDGYVATTNGNGKGAARNFSSICHETSAKSAMVAAEMKKPPRVRRPAAAFAFGGQLQKQTTAVSGGR